MKPPIVRHRHKLAVLLISGFLLIGLLWILLPQELADLAHEHFDIMMGNVRATPFPVFILLLGILPLAGVPVTALYLAAGAVYAPVYGMPVTFAGIGAGLLINLLLSYAYAKAFRRPVNRILSRFSATLPDYSGQPAWKLILIIRFAPGLPQLVQNFLLGILGVPVGLYLVLSFSAEMVIAYGYMTAGSSFATGRFNLFICGAGVIVIVLAATSLFNHRRA
ncbi:VTT domain-containing protein [Luteolibacter yonseiensis]|uniref:TVP38/TMEM64 family membrane protein n=1 Tax=Luteolibacter yonseiensis TaxID=1144680 RepID=A0A934R680_9BACT|nr:VTT domain-containing protein [Luteolibacter yonseiensis]MBK1816991.1 VTT domain-containing protein [Luteolibacter yonseiensis]